MGSRRDDYGEIRAEFSLQSRQFLEKFATERGLGVPTAHSYEQMSGSIETVVDEILTLGMDCWPAGYSDEEVVSRERDGGDGGPTRFLSDTETFGMKVWPLSYTTRRQEPEEPACEDCAPSPSGDFGTAPRMGNFLAFCRCTVQRRCTVAFATAIALAGSVGLAAITPQNIKSTADIHYLDIKDNGRIDGSFTLIG